MNKVIKEELETMLLNQSKNRSQINEMEFKIDGYKEELRLEGEEYTETEEESIESLQLKGQTYDRIRCDTNQVSDKVFNTVDQYKENLNSKNKKDRLELKIKINSLKKKKGDLERTVDRIDNLIKNLPIEEKFIIKTFYLEKAKWNYVSQEYCKEFQIPKTINQLINIRNKALTNMLDIINIEI